MIEHTYSGIYIQAKRERFIRFKQRILCLLTASALAIVIVLPDGVLHAAPTDGPAIPDPNAPVGWINSTPRNMPASTQENPVDLEAETLIHNEQTQIVTAQGNVELIQAGRILKADAVSYNLLTDKVRATGNVVLSEADGTTYFADDVELTQDMKNGFVESLLILLNDGSRFTAETGTRTNGTVLELKQASYTPCEMCKEDPGKPPLWQIRAAEVTHDEAKKQISYKDAWFEFAGLPVVYTPYFSHPDGSEKQKSGFLTPTVGFDSELGASYQQEYYYAIAPDKDLTVGSIVSTDVNPVMLGEYRQRFENAKIRLGGSATYSDRYESTAGITGLVGDEPRGNIQGEGRWDMDENWRSGFNIDVVSNDQYLRQYDLNSEDILENQIYAERFDGRDYLVGRMMAFQDVRISSRQVEQPAVLPEVTASFYGDPNDAFGGRWSAELSALGLYRDGNGQDMARGSTELGWQKRYITGFGLATTFDAMLRGDIYNVQDRDTLYATDEGAHARGFAQANLLTSYPFVKRFISSQMILEPLVSVTVGTNVDYNGDIPNEDSQDFTLDANNLFENNRFPGYDLIEDRSRMTYGMRSGLYSDDGFRGEIFFGQSRRLQDNDNPFPEGSGLSEQESDYVGQIGLGIGNYLNLDYRFQLEQSNMASQRHEFDANATWDRIQLGTRYFYAAGLEGTDLDDQREQIQQAARFRFYDDWYLSGSVWYDFGENKGLRQAVYGIDYQGQCMNFSLNTVRTLTEEATGDSDTEIIMRIGLKNLGEFESSGISIGGNDGND